ncbi:hypothetical protein E2C01_055318 [Portunus trituberculatus]|uniref:Uncharacterized protein n=1 Tax=Portunus trituberculatus TaxID=210409 RepID=A0A5B7GM51_PORTR|nr:hypothetical protein [Portunus trituberculatus]
MFSRTQSSGGRGAESDGGEKAAAAPLPLPPSSPLRNSNPPTLPPSRSVSSSTTTTTNNNTITTTRPALEKGGPRDDKRTRTTKGPLTRPHPAGVSLKVAGQRPLTADRRHRRRPPLYKLSKRESRWGGEAEGRGPGVHRAAARCARRACGPPGGAGRGAQRGGHRSAAGEF